MKSNGLVLWVAGFAGIVLLYAAYKGKSPTSILTNYTGGIDGAQESVTAVVPNVAPTPTVAFTYTDSGTVDVPATYAGTPNTFIPHPV